ncbi:GNAT family N-acetyltransferase [Thiolapillus brandeum]|uniref:Acetyltransferase n=1 Tax=Thiolapillus brandeum TaxID=1076588 RepID=A0A7U6GJE1_9GAMM|nr:GNAT family N-acetyltransferase [Thiolapillus brandeum]BAO44704.1 acetyltransferase [Thiolapillus brandeum]
MHIRPATADDLQAVEVLSNAVNRDHHQALPKLFLNPEDIPDSRQFWSDRLSGDDRLFLVAETAEGIVGFTTARISENHRIPYLTSAPICRIGTICVAEHRRSQGIGTKLMAATEAWATTLGATEIHLTVMDFNRGALSFYEKNGYGTLSRVMAKPLDKNKA